MTPFCLDKYRKVIHCFWSLRLLHRVNNKTSFQLFDKAAPVRYYILTSNKAVLGGISELTREPYSIMGGKKSKQKKKNKGMWEAIHSNQRKDDRSKTAESSLDTKVMKRKTKNKTKINKNEATSGERTSLMFRILIQKAEAYKNKKKCSCSCGFMLWSTNGGRACFFFFFLKLHYWSQHLQEASTAFTHEQTLLCPTVNLPLQNHRAFRVL